MNRDTFENEGIQCYKVEECYLCGNRGKTLYKNLRDRLFGAKGIWDLMECPKCGLCWLNPRPTLEDIEKLYAKYYTHKPKNIPPFLQDIESGMIYEMSKCLKAYKKSIGFIIGRILYYIGPLKEWTVSRVMWLTPYKKRRLLDIGCGSGKFLLRMRNLGFEVTGIELDLEAVKVAKEKYRLNVYQGNVEKIKFQINSFDAMTLNHVIEHLLDPIKTLKECRRLLKDDGKIIIVTPNVESLCKKIFNTSWRGWEVPRHIFLFSPKTLKMCIEKAGLKLLELKTTAKGARSLWVASRLLSKYGTLDTENIPKEILLSIHIESFIFWLLEYTVNKVNPCGEEIVAIACNN